MIPNFFIGRSKECAQFQAALDAYSAKNPRIVFIYDAATHEEDKGGIGKTRLLHEFLQMAQAKKYQNKFIINPEIFDFREPIYRDRLSRISRFVRFLEKETKTADFKPFWKALREYYGRGVEVERVYEVYYACFKKTTQQLHKKIILFFDTYEAVEKTLNYTRYPFRFIEKPEGNLLFVISGRNAPDFRTPLWKGRERQVVQLPLSGFTNHEAAVYFKNAGYEKLGLPLISQLNHKAKGRPILLALMLDYIGNILRVEDILKLSETDFQARLVAFIKEFKDPPLNQAIIAMAHLQHRCDHHFFRRFVASPRKFKPFYERLRALSFVRCLGTPKEEYLILHDEMQRMVSQYVLHNPQEAKPLRQKISRAILPFFKNKVKALIVQENAALKANNLSRQQILRDEKLILEGEARFHQLYANNGKGLGDYLDNFYDPCHEDSLLDYCFIFFEHLQELERLLPLEPHERNRLHMRYMRLNMKKFMFTGNEYYRDEAKKAAVVLLKKARESGEAAFLGTVLCDYGQLLYNLGRQAEAESKLRESIRILQAKAAAIDHDLLYYRGKSENWLGYIFFQQGKFKRAIATLEQAEQYFQQSEQLFAKDQSMVETRRRLRRRQLDDWLAQVRGNLCRVYRERGELSKSIISGESSLRIRKQLGNKLEILKGLNSLGLAYERQGDLTKALALYREAEAMLRIVPDPILEGRTLTNKATVLFRREAFADLLTKCNKKTLPAAKQNIISDNKTRTDARELLEAVTSSLFTSNSRELAIAYNNLGELDLLEDQYAAAVEHFTHAVIVSQRRRDAYTLLNSLQRLTLTAYLMGDERQFKKFARNFRKTERRLKNREETARYALRFYLTLGNYHYDKIFGKSKSSFIENCRQSFQAYTEAIALAVQYLAPESQKLPQEVFAGRMLDLLKTSRQIPDALQDQLRKLWNAKKLDVSELEKYFHF